MINQGKLHGYIIYGEGLAIDTDIIKSIEAFPLPSNKKALHSFLGQINFVRNLLVISLKLFLQSLQF